MLTDFKNKSMTAAPDVATLRERAERLVGEETRQEGQLHAAQRDLTAAEAGINSALYAQSKGVKSREVLTSWMFAQSTAQKKDPRRGGSSQQDSRGTITSKRGAARS